MFDSRRIRHLNDAGYERGKILYWTEGALRVDWNCGLSYASEYARQKNTELYAVATIENGYQHENTRQLVFLMESLEDLAKSYKKHGLFLNVHVGKTQKILEDIIEKEGIGMLVASASYVRFFRVILEHIAKTKEIPVVLVDDASLLPPWIASDHAEYGAYTLRKKYWNTVQMLWKETSEKIYAGVSSSERENCLEKISHSKWYIGCLDSLKKMSGDNQNRFTGGERAAQEKWQIFRNERLAQYDVMRNDPNKEATSLLSPYLHFGCISPLQIYYESFALKTGNSKLETPIIAFLEECLVRRELAINMWYYEKHPEQWNCLPDWVVKTLDEDREKQSTLCPLDKVSDSPRGGGQGGFFPIEYSLDDLRQGKTEDRLWNAAQHELTRTGKIHGYVRMYWGKQLLKWFPDWRRAYGIGVYLNDTYAVDGCSPNGYTGIAWCFGKHDRPFPPKKIHYGLVRSMTFGGMKKKFDVEGYIQKWL